MIQITLSFPSYTAAAAALSRLDAPVYDSAQAADLQSVTALQAAAPAAPAGLAKRTRKAKAAEEPRSEEQKAAAGAAMHAAARVEVPAAAPAVDKPVDYATEVAPLITRAANNPAFGPSKTLAVLQSYGARKGSEVPAERLADLKLELEEVLAAAEVAA